MDCEIIDIEKPKQEGLFAKTFTLKNIFGVLGISLILYFGRSIFIPLGFAVLISFVLYPICSWFEKHRFGRTLSIAISMSMMTILILSVVLLLGSQLVQFLKEWPSLQGKLLAALQNVSQWLSASFGVPQDEQVQLIGKTSEQMIVGVFELLKNALAASASSVVMAILVPVYAVLILYHRDTWMEVLCRLFPQQSRDTIREGLMMTIHTYYNFIKGMATVYLIVGILNSIGLLLLGVPHAILFGFIASVLTFVPYVGIMIGSLLPITMAWIAYDSIWYPLGAVGIFTFVQYLEANIVFPVAVSSRLNVNTLMTLLAIFAGGIIWGVSGMILFVPFLGIIKLFADRNPAMDTLAILLGSKENKS